MFPPITIRAIQVSRSRWEKGDTLANRNVTLIISSVLSAGFSVSSTNHNMMYDTEPTEYYANQGPNLYSEFMREKNVMMSENSSRVFAV